LFGKPDVMKLLVIPVSREKDNIKVDVRELGSEGVDWIRQAQDTDRWWAVMNTAMNLHVL
jgi:hypothetical protein